MIRTWDALGRYNTQEDIVPGRRAICLLPAPAYRLLIDFLRCDSTFCNHFVPIFHRLGLVSLYLGDAAAKPQSSEHASDGAAAANEDLR